MYHAIESNYLNFSAFIALKEKFSFNAIKPNHLSAFCGENVYSGVNSDNEGCFLFEYRNDQKPVISFIILEGGKKVFSHFTNSISLHTVESLLRGNITKFCLQEQGNFCLHASAMCINDEIILFIGKKGAGKSTLATYFHTKGHAVWCDDYAVLKRKDNGYFVFQGETSLKINPDVATKLSISTKYLNPVIKTPSNWEKTYQSESISQKLYFNYKACEEINLPRKVAAIFFINQRVAEPKHLVSQLKETEALSVLMEEIMLPGLNSKEYLKTYFQSTMNLLQTVPRYSIQAPDDLNRINEVYDSILETINISVNENCGQ